MPRNGTGTYSLPQPPFVAGTVISSAAVNSDFNDIATALTGSLPRDGQAGMTGQFKSVDGSTVAPGISFSNEPTSGLNRASAGVVGVSILGTSIGSFTSAGWTGSVVSIVGSNGAVPVGTIADFAGASAPAFWLLCFGQAVSRTTNLALFTAIGTTYGSGDGSTTFNLPDARDYALVGKGNMGGSDAGRLTTAQFGSDPTVLGNVGGSQTRTLVTGNLPAYTPSGTVAIIPLNPQATGSGQSAVGVTNGTSGFAGAFYLAASGVTVTGSFTGSAQGGSSTAFAVVQPSLIVNKIIFAGV